MYNEEMFILTNMLTSTTCAEVSGCGLEIADVHARRSRDHVDD